jgi:hypothetical protein
LGLRFGKVCFFTTKTQSLNPAAVRGKGTKGKTFVPLCLGGFVVGSSDTLSKAKIKDGFDRQFLLGIAQTVVERQAYQPVTDTFRDRAIPGFAAKVLAHVGKVERQVMEDCVDTEIAQILDESLAQVQVWHKDIEHMIRLFGMSGNRGQLHAILLRPIF